MDIQRGDQVYYRGEVWTVWDPAYHTISGLFIALDRAGSKTFQRWVLALPAEVQRVEQVR